MKTEGEILQQLVLIRDFTFEIIDKESDKNLYTSISKVYRIEKNINIIIDEENIEIAKKHYLYLANYVLNIQQATTNTHNLNFRESTTFINQILEELKLKFDLEKELIDNVQTIIIEALPVSEKKSIEAKIISDANIMDFVGKQGRERLKLMYEQMILKDIKLSKNNWYDALIGILDAHKIETNYGQTYIKPSIDKLYKSLQKERKNLKNQTNLILQKELKISDKEIKKLKKDIGKNKNRDDRGIQTLFRNTSKNHYTLNKMVDGKARIMITINSIILSLILGGIIGKSSNEVVVNIPSIIFAVTTLISIVFAIISITPNRTQGNFTEEDIRSKKGNLLYFGNFHNMHYRDFEWAFLQLLQDKDYLYSSMIRDFYYQGQILHVKNKLIRISLYSFLIGLVIAIASHFVIYWL
ncbi:Pycsar system effector family protein [uncultured Formosa sp.]|uniref:Pycsar system effector family protein n=1 Tax=uncultured Formosa sp. TaxID=255435 RepID=UPI0026106391|nr:Pycsar system effector family protein [uncultured Formosa sp.]